MYHRHELVNTCNYKWRSRLRIHPIKASGSLSVISCRFLSTWMKQSYMIVLAQWHWATLPGRSSQASKQTCFCYFSECLWSLCVIQDFSDSKRHRPNSIWLPWQRGRWRGIRKSKGTKPARTGKAEGRLALGPSGAGSSSNVVDCVHTSHPTGPQHPLGYSCMDAPSPCWGSNTVWWPPSSSDSRSNISYSPPSEGEHTPPCQDFSQNTKPTID